MDRSSSSDLTRKSSIGFGFLEPAQKDVLRKIVHGSLCLLVGKTEGHRRSAVRPLQVQERSKEIDIHRMRRAETRLGSICNQT